MLRRDVYVVAAENGTIKVGVSRNPYARIRAMDTGSPLDLRIAYTESFDSDVALIIEQSSHALLMEYRKKGEWFLTSPEVAIESIKKSKKIVDIVMRNSKPTIVEKNNFIDRFVPIVHSDHPPLLASVSMIIVSIMMSILFIVFFNAFIRDAASDITHYIYATFSILFFIMAALSASFDFIHYRFGQIHTDPVDKLDP